MDIDIAGIGGGALGGIEEDGTATRVLLVLGRLALELKIISCTTLLCFLLRLLNLANLSKGLRSW